MRIKDVALFDLPVVTTKEPVHVSDVFDDLKREEAFFQQALETVKYAVEKAKMENITMLPPSDEEGEMLRVWILMEISVYRRKAHRRLLNA